MKKLRSAVFGIAFVLSLASAPARAQDPVAAPAPYAAPSSLPPQSAARAEPAPAGEGAWNTPYGMIFSVQNVFQNESDAVIGDFGGGVGLQLNFSPQRALRFSVSLARETHPAYTTESTDLVTGTTTESFVAPAFTSRYDVDVGALYVMRLSPSSIAPYLGFGGGVGYFQQARSFENDTGVVSVTNVDDMYRAISLNATGVLGVEWRMHRAVSLFAEYGLGVDLVTFVSDKGETRTTSKLDGSLLAGTETDGSSTKYLDFGTGLGQGGQIGLIAFF
jgi:hypothetical protein